MKFIQWNRLILQKIPKSMFNLALQNGSRSLHCTDLYGNCWLIVRICGKCLGLLAWDTWIALHNLCHDTTSRLNAKGQGCHINKQHILDLRARIPTQDGCLYCSTISHSLIRVDGQVKCLTTEEILPISIVYKCALEILWWYTKLVV